MDAKIIFDPTTERWLVTDLDRLHVISAFPLGHLKEAYAAQDRANGREPVYDTCGD